MADLIRLCRPIAPRLQDQYLAEIVMPKNLMAASRSVVPEAVCLNQRDEIRVANVGEVSSSNPVDKRFMAHEDRLGRESDKSEIRLSMGFV